MTPPPWTLDANAQALAVSAALEAAREDGARQERARLRVGIVALFGEAPAPLSTLTLRARAPAEVDAFCVDNVCSECGEFVNECAC